MRELDKRADTLSLTLLVVHGQSSVGLLISLGSSGLGLQGREHGFGTVTGYMTTFATEEAEVAIHSLLSLLLSQLAILSKFRGEVRLVAVRRACR